MDGWLHCLLTNCPEIAIQHMSDWILYQTTLWENMAVSAASVSGIGAATAAVPRVDRRRPTGAKSLPVSLFADGNEDTIVNSCGGGGGGGCGGDGGGVGGSIDENMGCGDNNSNNNNDCSFHAGSALEARGNTDDAQTTEFGRISTAAAIACTVMTGVVDGGRGDGDNRGEAENVTAAGLLPVGDILVMNDSDQGDVKGRVMTSIAGGDAAQLVSPSAAADLRIRGPSSRFGALHDEMGGIITRLNSSSSSSGVSQCVSPVVSAPTLPLVAALRGGAPPSPLPGKLRYPVMSRGSSPTEGLGLSHRGALRVASESKLPAKVRGGHNRVLAVAGGGGEGASAALPSALSVEDDEFRRVL